MKFWTSLLIATTLLSAPLSAQTGSTAAKASQSSGGEWKNWTFVAVALVTATAGVLGVALDYGNAVH